MTEPDDAFWNLADSFVELANRHIDNAPAGKVSAALMYAAARFNCFTLATVSPDLATVHDEALNYLVGQYTKMVRENLLDKLVKEDDA